MNNIAIINTLNMYNNQRKVYIEFDEELSQIDFTDNRALDQAVEAIRDIVNHMTGLKLHTIVDLKKYVINHRQMERAIKQGLQCYGMSGATTFDNEQLATTMLDAPVRDYRFKYFMAPRFHRLGNLNVDEGKAVQALWNAVLHGLVAFYGKKKITA